jgi:hypothetical protein
MVYFYFHSGLSAWFFVVLSVVLNACDWGMFECVRYERMAKAVERCRNPWNAQCKNVDVELYISFKGEEIPICSKCWRKLAEADVEW